MSRMSELDLCIGELRNAAQSLMAVADGLSVLFRDNEAEPEPKVQTVSAESTPAPKAEPSKPNPVTLEQVRAVLAEKSRAGYTVAVRELLLRHGANKLSEIDSAEYPALLAEAAKVGLAEGGANG